MWTQEKSQPSNVTNVPQNHPVPHPAPDHRAGDTKTPRQPTLGSSIFIKGVLTGSEDLTVDGRVEGRIQLPDHTLTVGPNAKITAEIVAKVITVFGSVKGNVTAHDRLDIRSTASLEGEVTCARISIQEGAAFSGSVSMGNKRTKSNGADPDAAPILATAV